MSRSRGEPPKTLINKEYPFQVVLFMTDWHRTNLNRMLDDRTRLGGYHLWNVVLHDIKYFEIAMFQTEEGQQEFIRLYGGVTHDPWDKKSKPWETYFDKLDRRSNHLDEMQQQPNFNHSDTFSSNDF